LGSGVPPARDTDWTEAVVCVTAEVVTAAGVFVTTGDAVEAAGELVGVTSETAPPMVNSYKLDN
jgi:hypothetical protein